MCSFIEWILKSWILEAIFASVVVVILAYFLWFAFCSDTGSLRGKSLGGVWGSQLRATPGEPPAGTRQRMSPPLLSTLSHPRPVLGQFPLGTTPVSFGPAQDGSGPLCFCASSGTVRGGGGSRCTPPGGCEPERQDPPALMTLRRARWTWHPGPFNSSRIHILTCVCISAHMKR